MPFRSLLPLVRRLQILGRFFQRALRIVLGPLRLLILVDGAFALAGDVEDLAEEDMRPYLGPLRLQIPILSLAEFIRRSLVVALFEKSLGNTEMRQ